MLTNSDCTIYSRIPSGDYDEWQRVYVEECWWHEDAKSDITTNGLKSADVLTVRIPDMTVSVKKGDVIIKGDCDAEIKTIKDLSKYSYFTVTSVNYNSFGSNQHIKVVGS